MTKVNRQITLASRPVGYPKVSDFHMVFTPIPAPGAGEVLVRTVYLSLDPYMRGRMNGGASYAEPVALGGVMTGGAVGFVMASEDPELQVGDAVEGSLGWQEYAVVRGSALRKVDPDLGSISTVLGVLGVPGLTAYFGLLDVCVPRPGETVVVSAASGAIGMIAGQIAKLQGCRVVGVAGADAKISWLIDELHFDAAINYKDSADFESELERHCPEGVDIYFDNVGGTISDAVVERINTGARICVCRQIHQHDLEHPDLEQRWLRQLTAKQASVHAFRLSDYAVRFPEGCAQLSSWLQKGKLTCREDVAQGIESAPQAFIGMLQGRNQGKQLVQLSEL